MAYIVNRTVYSFVLRAYGRHLGYWLGVATEVIRSFCLRVWVVIIMARIAANLAERHVSAAKNDALLFFIVYVIGSTIGALGELVAMSAENDAYESLSFEYARKLTGKDMAFYRDHQSGYLVSLFRQHLDSTMILVRLFRIDVVRAIVGLAMPAIVLGWLNWPLGLISLGVIITQLVYVVWSSAKTNYWRQRSHEIYRKVTGEVADAITNITAFKSSGAESAALSRVKDLAVEETKTFWHRRKTSTILDMPRDLITAAGVTLAILIILGTRTGGASLGLIVLTLTYMFNIVRTVGDLPNLMQQHDDLVTKLAPTLEYLTSAHETITDPEKPGSWDARRGAIDIEHVDFSYESHKSSGSVEVFRDLTIHIKAGEQVGIVGLSGAGKSTLASLLMRFDDVTDGAIKVDGHDIRSLRQTQLRSHIAYVPQEPLLFHRTIRENIAYFNENASDTDIKRAAGAAHAADFIAALPQGYASMVGERGVKLSGGQKQRVVIARAILKNAPIMIFDEATSALDTESEKIIQQALPEILGRRTAIIIAHRLSTIAGLDRILVMDSGRIIEQGTHSQLLALGGRYASLWHKQVMTKAAYAA
jgi:ATP-binding cassette subfamily B protein